MSKKDHNTEDELTDLEKFEIFVVQNAKLIVGGAIAILVAVSVWVIADNFYTANRIKKMHEISEAKTEKELKDVISKYASSDLVFSAQFKLAKIYLDQKKTDEAITIYKEIVKSAPISILKVRAKLNIAALLENEGKTDEAIKIFEEAATTKDVDSNMRAEAKYSLACIYISQKKLDDAKKLLKEIDANEPIWGVEADLALKRM
jgi:predicted negative regulator of RcsB-dependent stress response